MSCTGYPCFRLSRVPAAIRSRRLARVQPGSAFLVYVCVIPSSAGLSSSFRTTGIITLCFRLISSLPSLSLFLPDFLFCAFERPKTTYFRFAFTPLLFLPLRPPFLCGPLSWQRRVSRVSGGGGGPEPSLSVPDYRSKRDATWVDVGAFGVMRRRAFSFLCQWG